MTKARAFCGFRFPAEVILWAVRWYLQFPVSYRNLELMLADRGVVVDHTTTLPRRDPPPNTRSDWPRAGTEAGIYGGSDFIWGMSAETGRADAEGQDARRPPRATPSRGRHGRCGI